MKASMFIFNKNKIWILDDNDNLIIKSYQKEIKSGFPFDNWLESYKKLGGIHNLEEFKKHLEVFFVITMNACVLGDLTKRRDSDDIWEGGSNEALDCWEGYFQYLKVPEAELESSKYFKAVDSVTAYT